MAGGNTTNKNYPDHFLKLGIKPLTMNTQQLSVALGLPSLVISFVVIPAVMNTRRAVTALFPLNPEKHEVASITFIELYNGVVMNNMMGLLASLVIVLNGPVLLHSFSTYVLQDCSIFSIISTP
ncbi:hypothetical protein Leryth_015855 [Lithospermum erythrorhizon]|nr:hypothetical protein Leryth_015855 [Lithospermum erythrorhizon]